MAEEEKQEATDAEEVKDDATEDAEGEGAEGEGAEGEDGEKKEKKSGGGMMKILLMAGIPLLLILIVAGVLFFTSFGRGLIGLESEDGAEGEPVEEVVELPEHISYYDMPELLVNIQSSSSKRKPYLRLAVKFELHDPEAVTTLDLIKPRIIDSYQVYLRELRVDDLEGSAGSQRLKEELLKRVNAVAAPVKVIDVLFQVFVVQ